MYKEIKLLSIYYKFKILNENIELNIYKITKK